MYKDLDTIILTHDIEAYGLKEGQMGAIVHVHEGGKGYEVEFVDPATGRTTALITLFTEDIRLFENTVVVDWSTSHQNINEVFAISNPNESTTDTEEFNYPVATI